MQCNQPHTAWRAERRCRCIMMSSTPFSSSGNSHHRTLIPLPQVFKWQRCSPHRNASHLPQHCCCTPRQKSRTSTPQRPRRSLHRPGYKLCDEAKGYTPGRSATAGCQSSALAQDRRPTPPIFQSIVARTYLINCGCPQIPLLGARR